MYYFTPIAHAHGVESVSVFGSYSRGDASAESDVDLKIEKGQLRALFQLSRFRLAVEGALNLSVDLITSEASDPAFLKMIQKENDKQKRFPLTGKCVILFN